MVRVKRVSAPGTFPTPRKSGGRFAPTPTPGPHSKNESAPLGIVIRDALGLAENMREVRSALTAKKVTVNGIVRNSHRFPVGIFDVVGVVGDYYRTVPTAKGFTFIKIPKKEADLKVCRIENKTVVRKGRLQVNLSDGTNILTDKKDYKTGDTVVIKTAEQRSKSHDSRIGSHIKRSAGALCMLIRGRNVGKLATIESINVVRGTGENTATLNLDGRTVQVPVEIVFVVGEKEPVITLEK